MAISKTFGRLILRNIGRRMHMFISNPYPLPHDCDDTVLSFHLYANPACSTLVAIVHSNRLPWGPNGTSLSRSLLGTPKYPKAPPSSRKYSTAVARFAMFCTHVLVHITDVYISDRSVLITLPKTQGLRAIGRTLNNIPVVVIAMPSPF